MARTKALTLKEVCTAIQSWGTGAMSDDELFVWVTNNYFPAHQQVATAEPDRTARAIGAVLTEFECAKPPYPFQRNVAAFALAFIGSPEVEYEQRKTNFYESLSCVGAVQPNP